MIDFDPISAGAAREAIDVGVYGTKKHGEIEAAMRAGVYAPTTTPTPPAVGKPERARLIRAAKDALYDSTDEPMNSMDAVVDAILAAGYRREPLNSTTGENQ